MLTYADLQTEVKFRATRDQSGTEFDTNTGNLINSSLYRLSREALWKPLRRTGRFTTDADYTTGTGAVSVTNGSKSVTVTGATFLTAGVKVGRRVALGGSTLSYVIRTITGETTLTVDKNYDGTTSTTQSYTIYGTEEYNLPAQATHRSFLWHENFGYPYKMFFMPDSEFFDSGVQMATTGTPTHYRSWTSDMVLSQPLAASVMRVVSSSSTDTSKSITVFGMVSGYPDYEVISTNGSNGTTAASGSKSFTSIERVVKSASTTGRITVDSNSGNNIVAVLPVGDTVAGLTYTKVSLWPLPQEQFDVNVWYYKDPYRLVNDGDVHELGHEFDEAIILLSVAKIKYESSQKEGDRFISLYADEVKNLRKFYSEKIDWNPTLKKPKHSRKDLGFTHGLMLNQVGGQYGVPSR